MEDKVYGSDDEWVWAERTVTKVGASSALELTTSRMQPRETTSSQKSICQVRHDEEGAENLCLLNSMDEKNILSNLQKRFHCKLPYTSANDICIAVNPYSSLNIYDEGMKHIYAVQPPSALPAHLFALSRASYDGMRSDHQNQSLLVSGESGAGKTESVKLLLDHIAFSAAVHSGSAEKSQLFEKILMANPLLESFGNAKTSRNFNSSRFGKYVQLHFDGNSELQRSTCTTYLLEKSRVVNPPTGDSNFHIFHELLAAPETVRAGLYLSGMTAADLYYTAQVVPSDTEHAMYASRFEGTCRAFKEVLGLSEEVIQCVLAVLAGVLYLGQLQLENSSNSQSDSQGDGQDHALDDAALAVCASLLQVDATLLHQSLTIRILGSGSSTETIRTTLSQAQALLARDALAKEMYARLFAWIVQQVNDSTHLNDHDGDGDADASGYDITSPVSTPLTTTTITSSSSSSNSTVADNNLSYSAAPTEMTISLLDIFGFENFTHSSSHNGSNSCNNNTSSKSSCCSLNGFEQLCINYCNEKLQHMFTNDVIIEVQQEFAREGLMLLNTSDENTDFGDNNSAIAVTATSIGGGTPTVLRLFEHRSSGLINLLNEECIVPGGCEASFLTKLLKTHASTTTSSSSGSGKVNNSTANGSRSRSISAVSPLQAVPFSATHFTVHHYADSVTYTTQSFLEKNRDTLPLLAGQLLATSENGLLATLFTVDTPGDDANCSTNGNAAGGLSAPIASNNYKPNTSPSTSTNASTNTNTNTSTNTKRAPVTTLGKFRAQLDSLLSTVQATRCRYIRCLKPNSVKSSTVFDSPLVLQQLRSGGVVQAVKVSRAAYPHKMTHKECLQRYHGCWGNKTRTNTTLCDSEMKRACEELWQCAEVVPILTAAASPVVPIPVAAPLSAQPLPSPPPPVQVGHTMVYFAAGVLDALDRSKLQYLHRRVTPIQATIRAWLQRKRYWVALKSVVIVQAAARRFCARTQYKMCQQAVTTVQRWYKACMQRHRDILVVREVFAQWAGYTSTVNNKLRALVQTAVQQHHHHHCQLQHSNRQDEDQECQQQQILPQPVDSTNNYSRLHIPVQQQQQQQQQQQCDQQPVCVASVDASTQTEPSSSLMLHSSCVVCPHCGQDPRLLRDISDATATSNSNSVISRVAGDQDGPSLTPSITAAAIEVTINAAIPDTADGAAFQTLRMFDGTGDTHCMIPTVQQHQSPSRVMQVLRAFHRALREEWSRSLLQDIHDSIDLPTALVLASAAMLGSILCNTL